MAALPIYAGTSSGIRDVNGKEGRIRPSYKRLLCAKLLTTAVALCVKSNKGNGSHPRFASAFGVTDVD
jgi:hypothetical protein